MIEAGKNQGDEVLPSWRQKTRDQEYQQTLVRFILLIFGLSYLGLGVYSDYYPISLQQYLIFAVLFTLYTLISYLHVLKYPGLKFRPYLTLAIDIFSVTVAISMTGGTSSPFFLLYIWLFVSHSVRFGRASLYAGSGLSVLCFVVVIIQEGSWSQKTFEAVFLIITLLALPVYLDMMLKKLHLARKEANEASRAKSAFLANMSHELRTPLNAVIGYSELLKEDAEQLGQKSFMSDLDRIHAAGQHLLAIISDVLDLSKIEAGKIDLDLIEINVDDLVNEIRKIITPLMQKNHNKFEITIQDDSMVIFVDALKLRQILLNLLGNAAKFTKNGDVRLEVSHEKKSQQDFVIFKVRDTGTGIPEDKMEALFEPFFQADASTTRQHGGSGLGLTISRTFCRMMGGDISVKSQPGEGSEFTIELPERVERRKIFSW